MINVGDKDPMRNPVEWVWRTSLLILGAVIALNLAICLIRPWLPWLGAAVLLAAAAWLTVFIVRWRRSRW